MNFHDGVPVTSADVLYSYDRIFKKGLVEGNTNNEGQNFYLSIMWDSVFESFEAPDPSTFVINAKGKTPLVIQIVSNGITVIVPKHISAVDPVNTLKETLHTVGSGPFRMVGDIGTTLSTLERNPDYFKPGLPYMDGYEAHLVLDPQARATAGADPADLHEQPEFFLPDRLGGGQVHGRSGLWHHPRRHHEHLSPLPEHEHHETPS